MADHERSPLLQGDESPKIQPSPGSETSIEESTPLLFATEANPRYDGAADAQDAASIASLPSQASLRSAGSATSAGAKARKKPSSRFSYIAMFILGLLVVSIMVLAFILPDTIQEYAKEAAVLEPTNLSIQEITSDGVRARVQANFKLDGTKVENDAVRRIGKAVTWVVRVLGNDETEVNVYLPQYDSALLGTATVPPLVLDLVDGKTTEIDFVTEIRPGDADSYRMIANKWLDGNLHKLRVQAQADVPVRSGILPLGTHSVSEYLTFEANKLPTIPHYNITNLNIRDMPIPGEDGSALGADVTLGVFNDYPVSLSIPELGFDLMVPSCHAEKHILVATALTEPLQVKPKAEVELNVHGFVREIPDALTRACPHSGASPLDMILDRYMHGEEATVYVRGGKQPSVPDWVGAILSSITVPVPFPGRNFDDMLKEFSLDDVDFSLPDPFAEPGDPDADPKVSGTIMVTAAIPSELNFEVNVTNIKAAADVYYHKEKFGELNVDDWQSANSTMTNAEDRKESELKIQSRMEDVPLTITDSDVFSEVIQDLFLGDGTVMLDVKAVVDVKILTVLGELVLKDVPADGNIPVKHNLPDGGGISSLNPLVGDVRVIETTGNSVTIQALVNVTNPTPYTARVPYVNIHMLCNDTIVGEATAHDLGIKTGNNTNMLVEATWDPSMGGAEGPQVGRDLISQYLSGWNVTLGVKAHRGSIPSAPALGEALSAINITVDAPKLDLPGDTEEDRSHFIRDATFHIFSSTATFTLVSPLRQNTLFITAINATAFYNHTEPVGRIVYDAEFDVPPGASTTPKLPVNWSIGGIGYDAVKKALGSQLKLDAFAIVGVRVGEWVETVWYMGKGIGAHVRL